LLLAVAAFCMVVTITSLTVNFVPILMAQGVEGSAAAVTAGLIGITAICARIGTGLLLDRFPPRLVGALLFSTTLIPCYLLIIFDGSESQAAVIALLLGVSMGAEFDVVVYLTSRYFDLKNFGFVFGAIAGLLSLGAGLGPFLAN